MLAGSKNIHNHNQALLMKVFFFFRFSYLMTSLHLDSYLPVFITDACFVWTNSGPRQKPRKLYDLPVMKSAHNSDERTVTFVQSKKVQILTGFCCNDATVKSNKPRIIDREWFFVFYCQHNFWPLNDTKMIGILMLHIIRHSKRRQWQHLG